MPFLLKARYLWNAARGSDYAIAVVFVMAVGIAYFPLLFGGQIIAGDERIDGYYQYSIFFDRAIQEGETILWNPHSYGGFPSFINQFGAFLFPPVYLLFYLLDPFLAFHVAIAGATFGGLWFAYLLGRSLFLSRGASFLMAIAYAMVQVPGTFHLGLSYAHSFMVLPFLLWAITRAKRSETQTSFLVNCGIVATAVAVGFLAGYFVTFIYALIFAGLYALFLDLYGERVGFGRSYRGIAALSAGSIVGVVAGLPQIIPLIDYQPYISRTDGFALEAAIGSGVQPLDIVRFFLPYQFQFPLDPGRGYFYFGLIALACIVIAIRHVLRSPIAMFFSSVYIVFLAFAANFPLFEWINVHVPPFSRIGSVSRWLLVGSLAPAYLAGYGFDRLYDPVRDPGTSRVLQWFLAISGVCLVLFVSLQVPIRLVADSSSAREWVFQRVLDVKGRSIDSLQHPVGHYVDVIAEELRALLATYSFANFDFTIFVAISGLSIALLYRSVSRVDFGSVRSVLMALVFLTFCASFIGGLGNTMSRKDYLSEIPLVAATISVHEPVGSSRYIAIQGDRLATMRIARHVTARDRMLLMRELLYRESGTLYGFRNISGFEPVRSMRQNLLIDAVLSPLTSTIIDTDSIRDGAPIDRYFTHAIQKQATQEEKSADIVRRLPLLSMMNVKYILSLYELSDNRLMPREAPRHPDLPASFFLYENIDVLPMVYFANSPKFFEGSERELLLEMLGTDDFASETIIECASCESDRSKGLVGNVSYKGGRLAATTESATGGWLVYSESHLPGWIAEIDGVRTHIHTANYLFQSIYVPAGTHQISFCYPGSFRLFLERMHLLRVTCAGY